MLTVGNCWHDFNNFLFLSAKIAEIFFFLNFWKQKKNIQIYKKIASYQIINNEYLCFKKVNKGSSNNFVCNVPEVLWSEKNKAKVFLQIIYKEHSAIA